MSNNEAKNYVSLLVLVTGLAMKGEITPEDVRYKILEDSGQESILHLLREVVDPILSGSQH